MAPELSTTKGAECTFENAYLALLCSVDFTPQQAGTTLRSGGLDTARALGKGPIYVSASYSPSKRNVNYRDAIRFRQSLTSEEKSYYLGIMRIVNIVQGIQRNIPIKRSAGLYRLASSAIEAIEKRKDEDIDEWARLLAGDVSEEND